jgi:hypothetical protein
LHDAVACTDVVGIAECRNATLCDRAGEAGWAVFVAKGSDFAFCVRLDVRHQGFVAGLAMAVPEKTVCLNASSSDQNRAGDFALAYDTNPW